MFIIDEDGDEGRVVKGIPVQVSEIGDNGAVTKCALTLDYKILPTDQSDAVIKAAQDGDDSSDLLKVVVVGWGQVKNRAGDTVDFSAKALDAACKKPNFRSAALNGYYRTAAGEKPRRGN